MPLIIKAKYGQAKEKNHNPNTYHSQFLTFMCFVTTAHKPFPLFVSPFQSGQSRGHFKCAWWVTHSQDGHAGSEAGKLCCLILDRQSRCLCWVSREWSIIEANQINISSQAKSAQRHFNQTGGKGRGRGGQINLKTILLLFHIFFLLFVCFV